MNAAKSLLSGVSIATAARLCSIFVAIFSVPILLALLGSEKYGVWVTFTSILGWIGLLDFGVGNSLRNSVASILNDEDRRAVVDEFVGYFWFLTKISIFVLVLFFGSLFFVGVFRENFTVALFLYLPYIIFFPFMISSSVLLGSHKIGLQSVLQSASSWIFFLFILCCSLVAVVPTLQIVSLVWSLLFSVFIIVSMRQAMLELGVVGNMIWSKRKIKMAKDRFKLGLSFLALQLSSLALFSMGNVIIYNNLGPTEVSRYDVLNKVFQVGLGLFSVVISASWSKISRMRAANQLDEMRVFYVRLTAVALLFGVFCVIGAYLSPEFIFFWTRGTIEVSRVEALIASILVSIQSLAYVGAVFLNAFERIKEQVYLSFVSIMLMLPLSHVFFKLDFGIASVPMAAALLTCLPMFFCNILTFKLLFRKNRNA